MTSHGSGGKGQPPPPAAPAPATGAAASHAAPTASPGATDVPPPSASDTVGSPPLVTPPHPAGEEPLLPPTYDENDLRSAVGASPLAGPLAATTREPRAEAIDRRDGGDDGDDGDDGSPRKPRSRKTIVVSVLSIVAGLSIAALVFLGRANSDRYLLVCEAERAVAEQGRAFPPWGIQALGGDAWKPIKITPETRCQPHETDDLLALERLYLAMILDQATGLLTAREVTQLDDAEALLKQALLLTRPPEREPAQLASERNEHHKEIERMLGDVTYWRASAKLHDAATALTEAAKQFDSAAAQDPRHVSDAAAWAAYARRLAQELHKGPAGAMRSTAPPAASAVPPTAPPAEHPDLPAGVALPVEPGKGSAEEPSLAPGPAPAPAPPDAGVPTGGVLL